jgi:hypothetical protein
VLCLQQSGIDRYAEAEACIPQLQHKKECSENMLTKEIFYVEEKTTSTWGI